MSPRSGVAVGALGMGCLAVVAGGAGFAFATTGGTQIHACVAKSDGGLRIVSASKDCTSHERPLSWNSRGARGPRGLPGAPATSGTFQMYANVDDLGHLGSNYDAMSAQFVTPDDISDNYYAIKFSQPIGSCALLAQPGYAGGDLDTVNITPIVTNDDSDADTVDVKFPGQHDDEQTAFMVTVTCHK